MSSISSLVTGTLRDFKTALPQQPIETLEWLMGRVCPTKTEEIRKELVKRATAKLNQAKAEAP